MEPVLCLITDRRMHGREWRDGIVAQVAAAARAGVHLIQVREADLDGAVLRDLVSACLVAARGTPARVLVNERLDVAIVAGAHGVHLRGDSMPASRVRSVCPRPFVVGRSVHTLEEARTADTSVLDYLMFGTVFATTSKPGREPAGLDALAAAAGVTALPVLAVGGITPDTIPGALRAGAAGAAAIGIFAREVSEVVERLRASRI